MTRRKGSGIPTAVTDDPVEVDSPNSSENSRLRAATAVQSSVKPSDYPAEKREQQVAAATGAKRGGKGKTK
jgi:hypothetical protein